jgi:menaquinone-dependent protoporphyrinogen oxidase
MKVVIIYTSKYGQTKKIAEFMKNEILKKMESTSSVCSVDLLEISRSQPNPVLDRAADTVIIGAPVYGGRFSKKLIRWAAGQKELLRNKSLAYFTVSMNVADNRPGSRAADEQLLRKFINSIGLVPQFVASFAGSIKYQEYGWFIRAVMKRISKAEGGPTDTGQNFEFTDWNEVSLFTEAVLRKDLAAQFSIRNKFPKYQAMDHLMPEFEQIWSTEEIIQGSPSKVFEALSTLPAKKMKMANFLAKIRTLGRAGNPPEEEDFMTSAEKFGNVALYNDLPREVISGLVGKFWQLDFGIRKVDAQQFPNFNEPDFAKVACNFLITPGDTTEHSCVYSEMRIHSTTPDARRKFKLYWLFLSPGIRLFMRSALAALRRHTEESQYRVLRRPRPAQRLT